MKHDNNRRTSNGQQVNANPFSPDINSLWMLEPVNEIFERDRTELELKRNLQYVRIGDKFRLFHNNTNSYLNVQDIAAPITPTNYEVTTLNTMKKDLLNSTVFQLQSLDSPYGAFLQSKKDNFKIFNVLYDVAIYSDNVKLHYGAFNHNEVSGALDKAGVHGGGKLWYINNINHERYKDGIFLLKKDVDIDYIAEAEFSNYSFKSKFIELHLLMFEKLLHSKDEGVNTIPVTSWPFLTKGISLWADTKEKKEIYILGNPVTWALSFIGLIAYVSLLGLDSLFMQRDIDHLGPMNRKVFESSLGFLFIGWSMNYFPFFFLVRSEMISYYYPSFIFSVMLTTGLIDLTARKIQEIRSRYAQLSVSYIYLVSTIIFAQAFIFIYFMPLTYGTGFDGDMVALKNRRWLEKWDYYYS
jgi:dolichyl-phosphate-mannose-protein mannosyltransferase